MSDVQTDREQQELRQALENVKEDLKRERLLNTRLRQAGDALVTNFTRAADASRGGGSSDYEAAYNEGRESAFDEAVRVVETAFRAALAASDNSTNRQPDDRALLLAAMAAGSVRWDPFNANARHPETDARRGELVFDGLRYATQLDDQGCPALPDLLRSRLLASAKPQPSTADCYAGATDDGREPPEVA